MNASGTFGSVKLQLEEISGEAIQHGAIKCIHLQYVFLILQDIVYSQRTFIREIVMYSYPLLISLFDKYEWKSVVDKPRKVHIGLSLDN